MEEETASDALCSLFASINSQSLRKEISFRDCNPNSSKNSQAQQYTAVQQDANSWQENLLPDIEEIQNSNLPVNGNIPYVKIL